MFGWLAHPCTDIQIVWIWSVGRGQEPCSVIGLHGDRGGASMRCGVVSTVGTVGRGRGSGKGEDETVLPLPLFCSQMERFQNRGGVARGAVTCHFVALPHVSS